MTDLTPTIDEWRRLYDAATHVKEIAPWEWMAETDVIGIQNPDTDELGFVSIMGALGEYYSVAVYLGSEGLYGFWAFEEMGPDAPAEIIVEIPHMQASFENRNELRKRDLDLIKELGLKFRGRHEWPMFRSYRPGFFPWYLEAWETRLMTHALEQTIDVAVRFRNNPSLLTPPNADIDSYLVRVPSEHEGLLVWEDQVVSVPPPEPEPLKLAMDMDVLEALKQLPLSPVHLEMDFFMFPAPMVEKRGARPFFLYMLLLVDRESGLVLGQEMLNPEPTLEAMWASVPVTVVHQWARIGIVPRQISVGSGLLFQLLQGLGEDLGFELQQAAILPSLDQAKEFLMQRLI